MDTKSSDKQYEYFAFISYKREDEKWAKWLQQKLESYSLPTAIRKDNPELPKKIQPVFRDKSDMSGGNLNDEIEKGLNESKFLIVICSPRSAISPWVSKEVRHFIEQGREEYIIPFIIDGVPNSAEPEKECFPETLRRLTGEKEILGININEMGRDAAVIKVISRMFNLRFDSLWQRHEKEKRRKKLIIICSLLIFVAVCITVATFIYRQNIELKATNWKLLENKARIVAENAERLIEEGDSYMARLICLEVTPKNLDNPEIPYVPEVEVALRKAEQSGDGFTEELDVEHMIFSHSGKYILAANGGRLHIVDFASGARLEKFVIGTEGHSIKSMNLTRDNRYLVFGYGKTVRVWDTKTHEYKKIIKGHSSIVHSVAISKDNRRIVSCADSTIRIWDMASGICIDSIRDNKKYIQSVLLSRDSKDVISYSDSTIKVWDLATKQKIATLRGHKGYIQAITLSHNGRNLISCATDSTIRIWNLADKQCVSVIKNEDGGFNSVVSSPDNAHIASSTSDGTIKIFNLQTGTCDIRFNREDNNKELLFSPDGKYLIYRDGQYGQEYGSVKIRIRDIAGRLNNEDSSAKTYELHDYINSMAISDDKKILICGCNRGIQIWDIQTSRCLRTIEYPVNNSNMKIAISPDSKYFVTGYNVYGSPDIIKVWELNTGKCLKTFNADVYIEEMAYSMDGEDIIVAGSANVDVLEISSGKIAKLKIDKFFNGFPLAISQNGQYIATTSDCVSRLWSVSNHENVALNKKYSYVKGKWGWLHHRSITVSKFLNDDRYLITGSEDRTLKIWDIDSDSCVATLKGHDSAVNSVETINDGKYIISGSEDGVINIWEINTGKVIATYKRQNAAIDALFSDGEYIIYSTRREIKFIKFPKFNELVGNTRRRFANRKLSIEERRKYMLE